MSCRSNEPCKPRCRLLELTWGTIADADRLSRYAEKMLVVDKIGDNGDSKGNIHQLVCDMETGLSVLPDASVDIVVSASALEHLTVGGGGGFLCPFGSGVGFGVFGMK